MISIVRVVLAGMSHGWVELPAECLMATHAISLVSQSLTTHHLRIIPVYGRKEREGEEEECT